MADKEGGPSAKCRRVRQERNLTPVQARERAKALTARRQKLRRLRKKKEQELAARREQESSSDSSEVEESRNETEQQNLPDDNFQDGYMEDNTAGDPTGNPTIPLHPTAHVPVARDADGPVSSEDSLGNEALGSSSSDGDMQDSLADVPSRGGSDQIEDRNDAKEDKEVPPMNRANIPALKEYLAKSLASKKATSNISDAGLQKIYQVMHDLSKEMVFLQENDAVTGSYRHSLKDLAMKDIPQVWNCVDVETWDEGQVSLERHDKLTKVPATLWNLGENSNKKVLRVHAYIKLKDLKEHHLRKHRGRTGFTEESMKRDMANATLSLDGVKESNKGKRTFVIVTIRFGACIYLWRVYNPLLGDKSAQMHAEDLCR